MFYKASESAFKEIEDRRHAMKDLLSFGMTYLDDALLGIAKNDLVLFGAASGGGKTQACVNIALANIIAGKRVHYFALEAEPYEIERRLKYQILAGNYFGDKRPDKPRLNERLTFDKWRMGKFVDQLWEYEEQAAKLFEIAYENLSLHYKYGKFGLNEMIEQVCLCSHETDLIIIDHIHVFDFDDDNETRAMKQIAVMARQLVLENGKPMVLVAHLRKRDRYNDDLVPGMEEFHGSSDLFKIATKVITLAPGALTETGNVETFVRIPKNRQSMSVCRYLARMIFSPKVNTYETHYKIGFAGCTRKEGFAEIERRLYPEWARPGEPSARDMFPNA